MSKPNTKFPGSRRPPVRREEEPDEPKTGRRGRVRRGRFSGKGREEGRGTGAGKQTGRSGTRRGEVRGGEGRDAAEEQYDDSEIRFSDLLMQLARREAPDKVQGNNHPEPLARLDYEVELELKNRAFQEFWTARGLPDKPNRILPSPRPRSYRTTTKRRVVPMKGGYELTFLTQSSLAANPRAGAESLVEPREHKAIYAFILSKLNTPAYSSLASALNYLIIRGDYERFTVLFNVHRLNADVVRKAKLMGDHLKVLDPKVISAFIFYDPSKSDYYFEARSPEGPWKMKKIYGPDELHLKVLDRTYSFNPTSFCQVNASILPQFLEKADQLLKPKPEYRLLDLYSGFGFFTLHLGRNYGEALGVDLGSASIESAQRMAAADPSAHSRFRAGRIVLKNLEKLLPAATAEKPEALLLDPPRQGTEPGVIRALASRNPARVLHIFCDLDVLPKEVNQWRKAGFMVSKVVPLDMFPGTDNLEVMVLFIPDRYGILNRIDKSRTETKDEGDEDPETLLDQDEAPKSFPSRSGKAGPRAAARPGPGGLRKGRVSEEDGFPTEKERSERFAKGKSFRPGQGRGPGKPEGRTFGAKPQRPGFRDQAESPRFAKGGAHGDRPQRGEGRAQGDRPPRGTGRPSGVRPQRNEGRPQADRPDRNDFRPRGEDSPRTAARPKGRGPKGPGRGPKGPPTGRDHGDHPSLPDNDVRPGRTQRRDRKPRDGKPRGRKF
ncbi:MAG: tRNA (uracil-5-)-methyltransferase family protein [Fibrobacteres bacterium]|nr:tRNA (uracil-5-)-methyltransferase family protein [Fibrobacterota bacterium]